VLAPARRRLSRRSFLAGTAITVLSAPRAAEAQRSPGGHRIGVLAQDLQPGLLEAFGDELQKLGYVEGKNASIDVRNAAGRSERLAALAEELVRLKVDVILAVNTPSAQTVKKVTATIPVVMVRVADPVKSGLVHSLAHPGGNVTGLSFMPDELGAKGLELLREVRPNLVRVTSLYKADNPGALLVVTETERRSPGLQFLRVAVRDESDISAAFETAVRAKAQALFVMDDGAMTKLRGQVLKLAAEHALPVVSIYKDYAEAGGLIAYGPNLPAVYRRAAHYVDRILKGHAPGQLAVEQPTQFHLAINLKTAKALGLAIPPSVLLRADQVID
jgi:putative ABC transport system substrate-binding protein